MKQTFLCHQCGHSNPTSRVFCAKCGAKLDIAHVEYKSSVVLPAIFKTILKFVRAAVTLVLLGSIGLMLWPMSPPGAPPIPNPDAARRMQAQIEQMLRRAAEGQSFRAVLPAAEANTYLATLLGQTPGAQRSEGFRMGLRTLHLTFHQQDVTVLAVATFGPAAISYELKGVPRVLDGGFRFEVRAARIGHLPILRLGWPLLAGHVGNVFSRLDREKDLLNRLDRIDVEPGKVFLIRNAR